MHFWHKNVYDNSSATSSSSTCWYHYSYYSLGTSVASNSPCISFKVVYGIWQSRAVCCPTHCCSGHMHHVCCTISNAFLLACKLYLLCRHTHTHKQTQTQSSFHTDLPKRQCQCLLMQNKIHLMAQKEIAIARLLR